GDLPLAEAFECVAVDAAVGGERRRHGGRIAGQLCDMSTNGEHGFTSFGAVTNRRNRWFAAGQAARRSHATPRSTDRGGDAAPAGRLMSIPRMAWGCLLAMGRVQV